MKLENQVCTLEQAKKLKELGINAASAFYWRYPTNKWIVEPKGYFHEEEEGVEWLPAYNSAELGAMFPDDGIIVKGKKTGVIETFRVGKTHSQSGMYCVVVEDDVPNSNNDLLDFTKDTEAEASAAMLIYLLENNHTTPEEVNTRLNNQ